MAPIPKNTKNVICIVTLIIVTSFFSGEARNLLYSEWNSEALGFFFGIWVLSFSFAILSFRFFRGHLNTEKKPSFWTALFVSAFIGIMPSAEAINAFLDKSTESREATKSLKEVKEVIKSFNPLDPQSISKIPSSETEIGKLFTESLLYSASLDTEFEKKIESLGQLTVEKNSELKEKGTLISIEKKSKKLIDIMGEHSSKLKTFIEEVKVKVEKLKIQGDKQSMILFDGILQGLVNKQTSFDRLRDAGIKFGKTQQQYHNFLLTNFNQFEIQDDEVVFTSDALQSQFNTHQDELALSMSELLTVIDEYEKKIHALKENSLNK